MFPDKERFKWFENISEKVIKKCERIAISIPGFLENSVTVYVPGGDDKYPSLWIRDYVMQCRSGFISLENMRKLLQIILYYQNKPEVFNLVNGLRIDPWSIPDHIVLPGLGNEEFQATFPAGAVFFPGTSSSTDNQGDGTYGLRPPDDDIYEVIELVKLISDKLEAVETKNLLQNKIKGVSIIERLQNGMQAMVVDKETGLCLNTPENWAASNFHDGLKPMGLIAITSTLRFRAAKTMEQLYMLLENSEFAQKYRIMAEHIADSVSKHLVNKYGWVIAASEINRQPDVWSTSMAIYYGLLTDKLAQNACEVMLKAYKDGVTVNYKGYLRHTLTSADVIPGKQVWECGRGGFGLCPYGIYQSGGYWPQPLGYYTYGIAQIDINAARQIAREFIDHTREFENDGAPFEWINPEIPLHNTPGLGRWYGPSVALPLEGFRRLS